MTAYMKFDEVISIDNKIKFVNIINISAYIILETLVHINIIALYYYYYHQQTTFAPLEYT